MNGYTANALDGGASVDTHRDNDALTPSQFADTRKRAHDSPYHELIFATLADAIEITTQGVRRPGQSPQSMRQRRSEDWAWIRDRRDAPFSFVWCCQALSIDPDVLRERLTSHNGHIVFSREQRGQKKSKISHRVRRSQVGPRRKSCE